MKKYSLLWIVILFYLFTVASVLVVSLKLNHGDFVYALDDAYIHLGMAKNLVSHGHWATNQMSFTSASSSPLWVLIITSVYLVTGVNTITPFILNLLFGIFSTIIFYTLLGKYGVTKYFIPFLLAFIFITPLPAMLFGGMEHSAQIAFALIFVFSAVKVISHNGGIMDNGGKNYNTILFIVITPLFTAIRYEGLILTTLISILLFARGKKMFGMLIFFLGLLPPATYGIISISNGWLVLPNTILLKSKPPNLSAVGLVRFSFKAFTNITEPHVFVLLIIMSLLYAGNFRRLKNFWHEKQILLFVTSLALIINMSLIEYHHNGAFYRYEAYLMALGVAVICICIYNFLPDIISFFRAGQNKLNKYLVLIFVLIVISPLFVRVFTIFGIPHAMLEYHNQQYQMAKFVKLYAKDMNVGLNDIGMVSYYTNNKIVDLWGVANVEVVRWMRNGSYSTSVIDELAKKENMRLVICYQPWFEQYGGLPPSWSKLADWTMEDYNFFLGNSTVSIFSVNKEDEDYLKEKLKEFSEKMPASITVRIY